MIYRFASVRRYISKSNLRGTIRFEGEKPRLVRDGRASAGWRAGGGEGRGNGNDLSLRYYGGDTRRCYFVAMGKRCTNSRGETESCRESLRRRVTGVGDGDITAPRVTQYRLLPLLRSRRRNDDLMISGAILEPGRIVPFLQSFDHWTMTRIYDT